MYNVILFPRETNVKKMPLLSGNIESFSTKSH